MGFYTRLHPRRDRSPTRRRVGWWQGGLTRLQTSDSAGGARQAQGLEIRAHAQPERRRAREKIEPFGPALEGGPTLMLRLGLRRDATP